LRRAPFQAEEQGKEDEDKTRKTTKNAVFMPGNVPFHNRIRNKVYASIDLYGKSKENCVKIQH